jgi:Skp family chaperone for outer membrane proteins
MGQSSRRRALTIGVAMSALASFVSRTWGQTPRTKEESQPSKGRVTSFGSVDLNEVLDLWLKVPEQRQKFTQEARQRVAELARAKQRALTELVKLNALRPATPEHDRAVKEYDRQFAEVFALRKKFQTEMAERETELLADMLRQVRIAVAEVARKRGLSLVFQTISPFRRIPATVEAVVSAMGETVFYADPATDITSDVLAVLNEKK